MFEYIVLNDKKIKECKDCLNLKENISEINKNVADKDSKILELYNKIKEHVISIDSQKNEIILKNKQFNEVTEKNKTLQSNCIVYLQEIEQLKKSVIKECNECKNFKVEIEKIRKSLTLISEEEKKLIEALSQLK